MLRPLPPPPPPDRPGAETPGSPGQNGTGTPPTGPTADQPPGGKARIPPDQVPTDPAGDGLDGLIAAGRLNDAFTRVQSLIAARQAPPAARIWDLAERLRAAGQADPAFALIRTLAADGYGPAAFALAELYDPLHWSESGSPFSKPNADKARDWYRLASELGIPEAARRLDALKTVGGQP
jgi:serine/threonine-protein kinase